MKNGESKNELMVNGEALPSFLADVLDSKEGNEEVTLDDVVLPRLSLCQGLSPQLKKSDPKYIESLKLGDIFNRLTGEVLGSEVNVVSIMFRKEYLAFQDRKAGGAFGGSFPTEADARRSISEREDASSWEVTQADVNYVLLLDADNKPTGTAAISMTRTQIKAAKKWNSLILQCKGPRYATIWKLKSVEESNSQGSYSNWDVSRVGYITDESLFLLAADTFKSMSEKGVATDYSDEGSAAPADDNEF